MMYNWVQTYLIIQFWEIELHLSSLSMMVLGFILKSLLGLLKSSLSMMVLGFILKSLLGLLYHSLLATINPTNSYSHT